MAVTVGVDRVMPPQDACQRAADDRILGDVLHFA